MKHKRKKWSFGAVTTLSLVLFTGYALLDTFVIPRSYGAMPQTVDLAAEGVQEAVQEISIQEEIEQAESSQDGTAQDGITVELTEYRENDTTIYVADVWVSDPSQLKTALAGGTYGRNVKDETSGIAGDVDAILAVNGDFYGARNSGYVIRNGVLYRSTSSGAEDLVIYEDGSFGIIDEDEVTAEQLLEDGAVQVLSFGPALVADGEIAVTQSEEVGKAKASNPRTAIGIVEDGHYVFVVSDGRTEESEGLSLYELAEFLQELGVETAYNLDGGGSSTMVYQGEVVNNPTTSGNSLKERSVSDIVYIGY
ncbi:MAG: phosphodiester glycosidase family protein [Firmicutes bacterium]|nr:phosphodiester glycosidase family protein [Bacillota bacterium]